MLRQNLRADFTRLISGGAILSIGKWALLLIGPVALLYSYASVQSTKRHEAEQHVERLTDDLHQVAKALVQARQYVAGAQTRVVEHGKRTQVLSNEHDEILNHVAPVSIVHILRVDQPQ